MHAEVCRSAGEVAHGRRRGGLTESGSLWALCPSRMGISGN